MYNALCDDKNLFDECVKSLWFGNDPECEILVIVQDTMRDRKTFRAYHSDDIVPVLQRFLVPQLTETSKQYMRLYGEVKTGLKFVDCDTGEPSMGKIEVRASHKKNTNILNRIFQAVDKPAFLRLLDNRSGLYSGHVFRNRILAYGRALAYLQDLERIV